MSKNGGLKFLLFTALGAIAGYTTYMINKDEFSDETKDRYDTVLNKIKNVGTDIKRTYTSIGDKDTFLKNTNNLKVNAKKLALKTGNLITSATNDMYNSAKNKVKKAIENRKDDDYSNYDDLDENYIKSKKNIKKSNTKYSEKKLKNKKSK